MKTAKVLCITGMHRSGTSLTASWLEQCGVSIHDGQVFGTSVGNRKGLFEDEEFVILHNEAIERVRAESMGWRIFDDRFLFFDAAQFEAASCLVNARNRKVCVWGWKDPRTIFFLPQWKRLIPELRVLIVWRDCSQVVSSLRRRSARSRAAVFKISYLQSFSLWSAYNRLALVFKQEFPEDTLLLPLDYMLSHDKEVVSCIGHHLQIDLRYVPIAKVFDESELHKNRTSIMSQVVGYFYGVPHITADLYHYSDVVGCGSLETSAEVEPGI